MCPILFNIGPFNVYAYGLMVALGFGVSTYLMRLSASSFGVDKEKIVDLMVSILISGIIGARVLHVACNWQEYSSSYLDILKITNGGLAIQGGILAGLVGGMIFGRLNKMDFWKTTDLLAPYLFLGQAIGKIGCFLNGCCYGNEPVLSIFLPLQLVETLTLFLLYLMLRYFLMKGILEGKLFFIYLVFYSAVRFFLEFFRGDVPRYWQGFTMAQFISAGMFVAGLGLLAWRSHLWKSSK